MTRICGRCVGKSMPGNGSRKPGRIRRRPARGILSPDMIVQISFQLLYSCPDFRKPSVNAPLVRFTDSFHPRTRTECTEIFRVAGLWLLFTPTIRAAGLWILSTQTFRVAGLWIYKNVFFLFFFWKRRARRGGNPPTWGPPGFALQKRLGAISMITAISRE